MNQKHIYHHNYNEIENINQLKTKIGHFNSNLVNDSNHNLMNVINKCQSKCHYYLELVVLFFLTTHTYLAREKP